MANKLKTVSTKPELNWLISCEFMAQFLLDTVGFIRRCNDFVYIYCQA